MLKQALSRFKDQVQFARRRHRYPAFNTTIKPFDNINVRKAIIAAFDRDAAAGARRQVHRRHRHALPAARHPGFEEAGGLKQNTDLDFLAKPEGDPAWPRNYMPRGRRAGHTASTPAARSAPGRGHNADPGKKRRPRWSKVQIEKLGFKLNIRHRPAGHALH